MRVHHPTAIKSKGTTQKKFNTRSLSTGYVRTLRAGAAVSRAGIIGIVALILIIVISTGVLLMRRTPVSSTTSSSSTPSSSTPSSSTQTSAQIGPLGPPNRSVLVDDVGIPFPGDLAPDALDPATGFSGPDTAVFNNVFQELVELNGSSVSQVVPVLASNYTIQNGYQTYVFSLRPNVQFSNGDTLSAADVWFSFVREVYLGQAVGISNYAELTVNTSTVAATGLIIPWGIQQAIQNVTGLPAVKNPNVTKAVLNNILSNFNSSNSTIQRIISYPD